MSLRTLDDFDFTGKNVLIRVDVNVPTDNGRVTDLTRLDRIVPTVLEVLKKGGKPILLSHFGRPTRGFDLNLSTQQTVNALSQVLKHRVHFATSCIGETAQKAVETLPAGDVLLLENTRFHAGEKNNDPEFAAELAKLGDYFVSDTFSTAHRAHASVVGVAELLPSCAGRLMEEEIKQLEAALSKPERPVLAVVGGAKVSSKLELLTNLITPMDTIVIGGGMANTFLAAQGYNVGQSLCEHDLLDTAREILKNAKDANCEIVLPVDIVTSHEFKAYSDNETLAADACPADSMILDAGPKTVELIKSHLDKSKTVIWNGPLGAFEIHPYNAATDAAATHVAALTKAGKLLSVAGGGDTVAALNSSNAGKDFTYISTAGGAFLEWLEGKTLPGVAVLQN
ncbi:phosphoglycerate kinase [Amylibacter kogurei]|uniref:Phosphoglycerate kinase n=1 Tax=Paramylibacter kogurei TaxID=1889778 RepID=A0A2G5K5W8_9RHOB|nr:phosphoglycerate kinase [Amylibacter kogurei]PIB24946.1 phosphoglycerate kinase [Amylibacter kogurei]